MSMRYNPFKPNSPINPGMFIGRIDELEKLEASLLQTKHGSPVHFMITGERGIGKTSLLLYLRHLAEGMKIKGIDKFNYFVVIVSIDKTITNQNALIKRIKHEIKDEISKIFKKESFFKEFIDFASNIEAAGVKYNKSSNDQDLILQEFIDYTKGIMDKLLGIKGKKYDGIIMLMDEADNAKETVDLGSFLKIYLEGLQKIGCNNLLIGLAGLPDLRYVLSHSHKSSLRLFDGHFLKPLSKEEVCKVVDVCLSSAFEHNKKHVSIDQDALDQLATISEGYPHFIQQFGYSVFMEDTDYRICINDVNNGIFKEGGGFDSIGDKYYRDDYYERIEKDEYRQVLLIMADKMNNWVSRDYISKNFKGSKPQLNGALKALKERRIIIPKEGDSKVFRLQHKGFALWIKFQNGEKIEE